MKEQKKFFMESFPFISAFFLLDSVMRRWFLVSRLYVTGHGVQELLCTLDASSVPWEQAET